ncbi:SpoIIE family protein phosphatase [Streptomyces sp. NBC_01643]|uniref:SpoIIE family protein phosphatase n=1 Tax=Streptomyces sp. NBC_01643 TaxID=2975906 RepID=UPI00386FE867|nr:SpoIIE family protein phosphatase [Streptomyces sp. NBC_01643]
MGARSRTRSTAADILLGPSTAVVVVDGAGVVRGWSEGAAKLLGHSSPEVLGRPLSEVFSPAERATYQAGAPDLAARLGAQQGWKGRQSVRHRDGRRLEVEIGILPIQDSGDCSMRLILATDTTRTWWWSAGRSLLDGITHTAPVGVAMVDTELRLTWVNDAMERQCGIPRERFLGRRLGDILPDLDVEHTEAEIRQVLETGRPSTGREYFGHVLSEPGQIAYSTSCFRVENEDGRPLGACYIVLSTTDHYRARQKLTLLNEAHKRLGSTLDVPRTAQELADAAVPGLADHVTVDLLDSVLRGEEPPSGPADATTAASLRCVGHRSARAGALPPIPPGEPCDYPPLSATARALISGSSTLIPELDPTDPHWTADDPARGAYLRDLGIHSLMIVPIRARGTTLGAATVGRRQPRVPFQHDDLVLAEELVGHAAVCIDNARRYTHEHAAALTLQRSLLPQDLPEQNAVDAAYRYLPADTAAGVGGDWFDVIPLSGARVALVVGDVVGHGIHAAATMGRLRAAVQTLADIDLAPDEVLAHLDDMVSRIAEETDDQSGVTGATCLYAVYDPVGRHYTLARAGHPAPALVSPHGAARLVDLPSGPPLGLGGLPFESMRMDVPEGSILALYTDGLIQSHSLDADQGLRQLLDVLAVPQTPLEDLCDAAVANLSANRPGDDAALLLARTHALGEDRVASWDIAKDPAAVAPARARATRQLAVWGLDELAFTTELVVSELITNAIRYASGPIRLRLIRDRTLICEVSDGSSTSPHLRHARTTDEGGRGLFLIARFAQRWGARYAGDGKTIWSEQSLRPAGLEQDVLKAFGDLSDLEASGPLSRLGSRG